MSSQIRAGLLEGMSVQNIANALAHGSRDLRSRLVSAINVAKVDRLAIVEKAMDLAVGKVRDTPHRLRRLISQEDIDGSTPPPIPIRGGGGGGEGRGG